MVEPMHELSIMQSALSLALDQARQAGASRVHTIRLRIGALSGVVPDALEFAFEALVPGTLAEGAKLAVEGTLLSGISVIFRHWDVGSSASRAASKAGPPTSEPAAGM